jgi:hypothetical protein
MNGNSTLPGIKSRSCLSVQAVREGTAIPDVKWLLSILCVKQNLVRATLQVRA